MPCKAFIIKGLPCKRPTLPQDDFCYQHVQVRLSRGQSVKLKLPPTLLRPEKEDAHFWLRGNGHELALPAISGPITLTVLRPRSANDPTILVFRDKHLGTEGICQASNAVSIASVRFFRALAETTDGPLIISNESFYEETLTKLVLNQPALVQNLEIRSAPPLEQFTYRLLPYVLRQNKNTPLQQVQAFDKRGLFPNLHVLAGDARKIVLAEPATQHRFFWDVLLFGILYLWISHDMSPHEQQEVIRNLFDDLPIMEKVSGKKRSALINDAACALRVVACRDKDAAKLALFPPAYKEHSLLWKHLRRLPKQAQPAWKTHLTKFCLGCDFRSDSLEGKAVTYLQILVDFLLSDSFARIPRPAPNVRDCGLLMGVCLMDCYLLLRLHVKHKAARRVVLYYGQCHANAYIRFYRRVINSHVVQDAVLAHAPDMRCLIPPHDIEL